MFTRLSSRFRVSEVTRPVFRSFCDWKSQPRDVDFADILIVGGGPSGLSAAIRVKQLCQETGKDLRVCVLEKAAEIGLHTLSGAVLEPRALQELLSKEEFESLQKPGQILSTPATQDELYFLTNGDKGRIRLPIIGEQNNHGNFIISLGELVKWMGQKAESMGVEIYPGYPASEVLEDEQGNVVGVATGDVGITKKGTPGPNFQRGLELRAPITLFAEGCRGSCSQKLEAVVSTQSTFFFFFFFFFGFKSFITALGYKKRQKSLAILHLHSSISRTTPTFRYCPYNILCRIFYITSFTM
eukprot:TRINITY_DN6845_c0_g1_i8.p1 TRINITY_DN6845_c0_g1~~TRINITY_DN6845_c0_g1_i8.p1  ORF type:complete len:299 (+),score=55.44 TRINITY_DN6845_c0_g1_i8:17-913(+)